jgi:hypothetical protein
MNESFGFSTCPPPGYTEQDEAERRRRIQGTHIRMMGEYGVTMPLWDACGDLPEDHEFLGRELGISQQLVADLAVWGEAWDSDMDPDEHNAQGRRLFARLQSEIALPFTVALHL